MSCLHCVHRLLHLIFILKCTSGACKLHQILLLDNTCWRLSGYWEVSAANQDAFASRHSASLYFVVQYCRPVGNGREVLSTALQSVPDQWKWRWRPSSKNIIAPRKADSAVKGYGASGSLRKRRGAPCFHCPRHPRVQGYINMHARGQIRATDQW